MYCVYMSWCSVITLELQLKVLYIKSKHYSNKLLKVTKPFCTQAAVFAVIQKTQAAVFAVSRATVFVVSQCN